MDILIIGNGNIEDKSIIQKYCGNNIIICCDGGTSHAFEEGIIPHYIMGDMDSALPQILDFFRTKNVIFKEFSPKKDETDMELCLNFAIGLGAKKIYILGATGTRLDHTLANIGLLKTAIDKDINCTIIDKNNTLNILKNNITINGAKGDIVSLIPLSENVSGIYTKGLSYPLNNGKMEIGKPLGISNIMESDVANITIDSGYLLVIKSID